MAPPADPSGPPPAAVAPTAPVPTAAAPGGAVATSIDDVGSYFKFAWEAYRANFMDGFLTVGALAIPAAVVTVAFGWIPLLGALIGLLVALVEMALGPLSAGAMGRWAVSVAAGRSLSWKTAWRATLKRGVADWLNLFVISIVIFVGFLFLIVPGILLGVFALPAYLVERRTFVSANLRSLELVQKNLVPVLVVAIAAFAIVVPLAIAVGVTSVILGLIPVVGPPIAQALSVALSCLVMPYVTIMWARLYIDARAGFEQADATAEIAACHAEWSGERALESA
ncbi:MAG: hypothetical protein D6705_04525 [Deltaproteobacteria bacterium]|nr:MAG: hypothetical protein D6705_04525 [Deltaproteobacteria bacterium]